MEVIVMICFMFIGTAARPSVVEEGYKGADCRAVDLIVELPIAQHTTYMLSSTHTYVRRCMGVNDEHRACVHTDPVVKMEQRTVIKADKGSDREEMIDASWVSHETCAYKRRTETKCPIEDSRKCHAQKNTHYYDEVSCTCSCLVQIGGEDTCRAATLSGNRIDDLENKVDTITNELVSIKQLLSKLEKSITSKQESNTNIT
ncbi:unnamed protein product [Meganyctiphanes norvegica]|uniref:Uncharacterized protein n=1 Tax=Meganyctiphanes norvegica TaxID=48144 RepID=A0AAV2SDM6_MEGNR